VRPAFGCFQYTRIQQLQEVTELMDDTVPDFRVWVDTPDSLGEALQDIHTGDQDTGQAVN